MDFSKFCNICYNNRNLKDASAEEERLFKELIISIVGNENLIQKNKVFICAMCYYKLEGYDKFRQMILTNMIQMRHAYYQLKNKLNILKSPDIEKTLQEFLLSRVKYRNVDVFGVCPQVCDLTSENGDENDYVVESDELYTNTSPEEETSDEKLHSEIDLGVQLEEEVTGIACNTENIAGFDVGPEKDIVPLMPKNGNAGTETEPTSTGGIMETDYGENSGKGNKENIEDAITVEKQINNLTRENICGICDRKLCSRAGLLRHVQIHYKNFTCNECGKKFKFKYLLLRHQKTHKRKDAIFDGTMHEIMNEIPKHVNISKEKELYQCLECENTFSCKSTFKKHQNFHTQQRLHSEHLVNSKVSKCTICNKNNITEGNTYCKKCGDSFHQPMKCSKCPESFKLRSDLIFHEQDHNPSKFFSCNICHKTFFKVWSLKHHNIIHTGINPFICAICHVSLSNFQNLKRHESGHKKGVKGKKKAVKK